MTIDLAHSSAKTIEDVLAIATRPVVVSHTGVKGVELTDALLAEGFGEGEIRKIAGENVLEALSANLPPR